MIVFKAVIHRENIDKRVHKCHFCKADHSSRDRNSQNFRPAAGYYSVMSWISTGISREFEKKSRYVNGFFVEMFAWRFVSFCDRIWMFRGALESPEPPLSRTSKKSEIHREVSEMWWFLSCNGDAFFQNDRPGSEIQAKSKEIQVKKTIHISGFFLKLSVEIQDITLKCCQASSQRYFQEKLRKTEPGQECLVFLAALSFFVFLGFRQLRSTWHLPYRFHNQEMYFSWFSGSIPCCLISGIWKNWDVRKNWALSFSQFS